jgi:hypothetical protein
MAIGVDCQEMKLAAKERWVGGSTRIRRGRYNNLIGAQGYETGLRPFVRLEESIGLVGRADQKAGLAVELQEGEVWW